MKPLVYLALGGMLFASACDRHTDAHEKSEVIFSDQKTDAGSDARPTNLYSGQLFAMEAQVRRATFKVLLRQSGEPCAQVAETILKGAARGADMWRVTCTDRGDLMVSVSKDASTKILDCTNIKGLGLDCRKRW